jgi:hypothetical protein
VQYPYRPIRPPVLQLVASLGLLIVLVLAYLATMHALLDFSRADRGHTSNERDIVYAYVHLGFLALALVAGFLLGKWLSGLGFAFATLFFVVLSVTMVAAQMTSYELACHGHNDLVRHWQC